MAAFALLISKDHSLRERELLSEARTRGFRAEANLMIDKSFSRKAKFFTQSRWFFAEVSRENKGIFLRSAMLRE